MGRVVFLLTVLAALSISCGKKKGDNDDFWSAVNGFGEEGSLFLDNSFSIERLQDRTAALDIASTLRLNRGFDVINGEMLQKSTFGLNSNSYDEFTTHEHTQDPSTSMLQRIKTITCVLDLIGDYQRLIDRVQTRSLDIAPCLTRSKTQGNNGQSSGGNNLGSSNSDSSSAQKVPVDVMSFVNIDNQLIVYIRYVEEPANDWEMEQQIQGVFVINDAPSTTNPLGDFMLLMSGSDVGYEWSNMQVEVIASRSQDNKSLVRYRESKWGNAKLLKGIFDAVDGRISGGEFVAQVQGWDDTTGEPGGSYRVVFNDQHLLREKRIENPEEYFGPDYGGTISSEPVTECYKPREYEQRVHGYKVFNADGSAREGTYGFEVSSQNRQYQGWINYWGASFWNHETGEDQAIPDGTTVYKVNYDSWNETTGEPDLETTPYVINVKPSKVYKNTLVELEMSRLDGRTFDWVYDNGDGQSYRVRYDHAASRLMKVAVWRDGNESRDGYWDPINESEYVLEDWDSLWTWNDGLGGNVRVNKVVGGGFEAIIERRELITDDSSLPSELVCLRDCFKTGGISAADIDAYHNDYSQRSRVYVDTDHNILLTDVITYDYDDFVLSRTGSDVTLTGAANGDQGWGIQSQKLVTSSDLANVQAANSGATHVHEIEHEFTTWYSVEMGFNNWEKTIFLTQGGNAVSFDPPIRFEYELTADDLRPGGVGGDRVGQYFQLEIFDDYLHLPYEAKGYVTDAITGEQWEDWAPVFALKDGLILENRKIKADYIENKMSQDVREACDYLALPDPNVLGLPERQDQFFDDRLFQSL